MPWVRPGVFETRAASAPIRRFRRLDLTTLLRPANATTGSERVGKSSGRWTAASSWRDFIGPGRARPDGSVSEARSFGLARLDEGFRRRHCGGIERDLDDLVHVLDVVHVDGVPLLLGNLLHVLLVLAGHDQGPDSGAIGAEHLVLYAADRQHLAAQRDLAGHGDVLQDGDLGHRRE